MSLDIDRINGLLNIVKEAAQHSTKLRGLVAMATRELEGQSADALKEHEKLLADEAAEVAAKKQDALKKQQAQAAADIKSAELTSKPQEVKRPEPVARPASDFKPETSDDDYTDVASPVRRREVPEEATHG